ncbi:MAG TPA: hypothetical protein VMZ31_00325 [Phycisphaerae bacterium]|nr:hypothetical protein [Phycisphaerae bacterium]
MIQCSDCEHFARGPHGQLRFTCDPFSNVREPECLVKWQLIKIDMMVRAYQVTAEMYKRMAPLQEKIFRHMESEIDDIDEAESWKHPDDEDDADPFKDDDGPTDV